MKRDPTTTSCTVNVDIWKAEMILENSVFGVVYPAKNRSISLGRFMGSLFKGVCQDKKYYAKLKEVPEQGVKQHTDLECIHRMST